MDLIDSTMIVMLGLVFVRGKFKFVKKSEDKQLKEKDSNSMKGLSGRGERKTVEFKLGTKVADEPRCEPCPVLAQSLVE